MKEITKEIRINLNGVIQSDLDCITSNLKLAGYTKRKELTHSTFMQIYPEGKFYIIYCHYINEECLISPKEFIKEYIMETKTVKLTLEQAKELYNAGGNFKTIALGAYSEEELKEPVLPNSWEEFCKNYPVKKGEAWIDSFGLLNSYDSEFGRRDKNNLPNKETAEAVLALCQLIQLRDCYNQGWKPDWTKRDSKYTIEVNDNLLVKNWRVAISRVMFFKTEKFRDKFFENFKDLLEIAKELL